VKWIFILISALVLVVLIAGGRRLFAAHSPRDRQKQSMSDQALDKFETYYYRSPAPKEAPRMFEWWLTHDFSPSDPVGRLIQGFFFARVARDNPEVVRGYEVVLPKVPHEARLVILEVLSVSGDENTRKFLQDCAANSKFGAEKDVIDKILAGPIPAPLDIFQRPIEGGWDLDLLWIEFFVTGSPRPVLRIVDVLEWPDRLRGKLSAWMESTSPVANQVQLLEQGGFVLDFAHKEIVNIDDLDIFSVL
jgi:putative NIF3 family GTP cyclohydrolase 1 type 2